MKAASRILVIDDDEIVAAIVSEAAQDLGLDCVIASKAAEFPTLINQDISLILLDLMIPEMDGIEVLRLLGQQRCKARIVLFSGLDKRVIETAEKLAQALGLQLAGHLQKPFRLSELKAILTAHSAPSAAEAPAETAPVSFTDEELAGAVDRHEFPLCYQPQISLQTGEVLGLEALSRWQHPRLGLIYPDHFIPRLESLGLMETFCWDYVDQGLAEITQFAAPDGTVPRLAVNVSVSSLRNLNFPDTFMMLAQRHNFPAENIAVEITESGLIEFSHALDVLTRLRMRNFKLSIDDFGTGYSMMRQLQNVPAIELKIDKMFVRNMQTSDSDRVMVEKIIELGHELEMEVIAEGVETEDQLQMLRERGCDAVQGFLFARALPPEELIPWLADYRSGPLVGAGSDTRH